MVYRPRRSASIVATPRPDVCSGAIETLFSASSCPATVTVAPGNTALVASRTVTRRRRVCAWAEAGRTAAALRSGQLAIAARLGLAGYGLLLLAANVCLVGVPVLVLTYLGRSGRHPILRCASAGVTGLVLWVAVLVYGASWTSYWTTGAF